MAGGKGVPVNKCSGRNAPWRQLQAIFWLQLTATECQNDHQDPMSAGVLGLVLLSSPSSRTCTSIGHVLRSGRFCNRHMLHPDPRPTRDLRLPNRPRLPDPYTVTFRVELSAARAGLHIATAVRATAATVWHQHWGLGIVP